MVLLFLSPGTGKQLLPRRKRRPNQSYHTKENSVKRTDSHLGRDLACEGMNPCMCLVVRVAAVGSELSGVDVCHVKCEANPPTGTPLLTAP